jgi:WD40-like Beta Propeller Repeat
MGSGWSRWSGLSRRTARSTPPRSGKSTPAAWPAPRRLTRSVPGEANPAFLPDGTLLFVSERPGPQAAPDDREDPALWALPASGGEAARIAARPGKITTLTVAREDGMIAFTAATLPR